MNSFFIYSNYLKTRPLKTFDEILFHLPQLRLRSHKVTNSTTHLKKLVLTAAFMGLCASFSGKRRPRQQFLSLKPATRTIYTPSKDHSGNEHIATVFSSDAPATPVEWHVSNEGVLAREEGGNT